MNGERELDGDARLFTKRKIYMSGEIDSEMADDIGRRILLLNMMNDRPIDLIINSSGGNIASGLRILDDMAGSPAEIHTICPQKAYSMAAIIFSAGKKRYMYPHAKLLLHEPQADNIMSADLSSLKNMSAEMTGYKNDTDRILAENTGKSIEEIRNVTDTVTVFTAQEAIDFGLCDGFISVRDMLRGEE